MRNPIQQDVAQAVVKALNELYETDPEAITQWLNTRIPCNKAMADHPSAVVRAETDTFQRETYTLGFVGLLNGILNRPQFGNALIAVQYEEVEHRTGFTSFCVVPNSTEDQ